MADGWDEARGRIVSSEMAIQCLDTGRGTGGDPPYTHEENLVPPNRDVLLVFEDVRKPEHTSPIARCALWEHNDGTACPYPH